VTARSKREENSSHFLAFKLFFPHVAALLFSLLFFSSLLFSAHKKQKIGKLENWEIIGNWQHHKFTTHEKRWTRERERIK
jgi:hypothetical protein